MADRRHPPRAMYPSVDEQQNQDENYGKGNRGATRKTEGRAEGRGGDFKAILVL